MKSAVLDQTCLIIPSSTIFEGKELVRLDLDSGKVAVPINRHPINETDLFEALTQRRRSTTKNPKKPVKSR